MAEKEEKIKKIDLSRSKKPKPLETVKPLPVSAGPIDKVIELAFNPTREKIREMTIIDRMQARLLPLLDVINLQWHYLIEVATYRSDRDKYEAIYDRERPVPPDLMDEYMYRLAQWQKSRDGKNLTTATDIALAETEANAGDDELGDKANSFFPDK